MADMEHLSDQGADAERVKHYRSLMLPADVQQRHMRDQNVLCERYGETDIDWTYFPHRDWHPTIVEMVLAKLVSDVNTKRAYIGVTGCPVWRWRLCCGHNEGFRPHCDYYTKMYVLMCERSECIMVYEEDTIELVRNMDGGYKLDNAKRHFPGTMPPRQPGFVYLCVVENGSSLLDG